MTLNIKDPATTARIRELARATGENMTQAVRVAVDERLQRPSRKQAGRSLVERLDEIARHCGSLPVRSRRSEDDILGYDERGMPR